jgi:argininosuccinate lyase
VQHIVGKVAAEAFRQGVVLEALSLAQLQPFSAAIEEDLYPIRAP